MRQLAALLAVREIYFPPSRLPPPPRRMFDDKLMADSKVSTAGDINIHPRTQKGRSSLRQKLQNVCGKIVRQRFEWLLNVIFSLERVAGTFHTGHF